VESGDQRMQAASASTTGDAGAACASASVVHTPATVGARVGAAATSHPVVGSLRCKAGMGSWSQGVGYVNRRGLGTAVTAVLTLSVFHWHRVVFAAAQAAAVSSCAELSV
jgi:hypothetical protein